MEIFGFDDWERFCGVKVSWERIAAVGSFPWNDLAIEPCPFNPGHMIGVTHFAFVGIAGMTIMELQRLHPQGIEPRFASYMPTAWYSREKFAKRVSLEPRWYLLLRDVVPGSVNKPFREQEAMLPTEYEAPSAVAEAAKDLLYFRKSGVCANRGRFARTADRAAGAGGRVNLGFCAGTHIAFRSHSGERRVASVGIGASRRIG